jgi:hypothetical protein
MAKVIRTLPTPRAVTPPRSKSLTARPTVDVVLLCGTKKQIIIVHTTHMGRLRKKHCRLVRVQACCTNTARLTQRQFAFSAKVPPTRGPIGEHISALRNIIVVRKSNSGVLTYSSRNCTYSSDELVVLPDASIDTISMHS